MGIKQNGKVTTVNNEDVGTLVILVASVMLMVLLALAMFRMSAYRTTTIDTNRIDAYGRNAVKVINTIKGRLEDVYEPDTDN